MVQETGNNHIDFNKSEHYTLSIRLSTDGFLFSVYNPINDSTHEVAILTLDSSTSLAANLKRAIQENDFLQLCYKRVNVIVNTNRYTNLPLDLYNESSIIDVFSFNHSKQKNEIVLSNHFKHSKSISIFGMDNSCHDLLINQYTKPAFYCRSFLLNEFFVSKSHLGNSRKMYISFNKSSIDILCYERNHLQFINTFDTSHHNDIIYFVLGTWKQLNYDQQHDELHLTGLFEEKEIIIKELKEYIQQVYITNPTTNIELQALLDYASN